jgi:hypothetical protein
MSIKAKKTAFTIIVPFRDEEDNLLCIRKPSSTQLSNPND